MLERYAVINKEGGWLENIIVIDADVEKWIPEEGTIIKLASEVDFSALPSHPEEQT
jgi:hypothetical protein